MNITGCVWDENYKEYCTTGQAIIGTLTLGHGEHAFIFRLYNTDQYFLIQTHHVHYHAVPLTMCHAASTLGNQIFTFYQHTENRCNINRIFALVLAFLKRLFAAAQSGELNQAIE